MVKYEGEKLDSRYHGLCTISKVENQARILKEIRKKKKKRNVLSDYYICYSILSTHIMVTTKYLQAIHFQKGCFVHHLLFHQG